MPSLDHVRLSLPCGLSAAATALALMGASVSHATAEETAVSPSPALTLCGEPLSWLAGASTPRDYRWVSVCASSTRGNDVAPVREAQRPRAWTPEASNAVAVTGASRSAQVLTASRPRSASRAKRALRGAVIGATAGGVLGVSWVAVHCQSEGGRNCDSGQAYLMGGGALAALGAGIGAGIGALLPR